MAQHLLVDLVPARLLADQCGEHRGGSTSRSAARQRGTRALGEPGSRSVQQMNPSLVINRPNLVPHHQRLVYGLTTLAVWYFWLYLWLPLLTFVGWLWSGMVGYEQMVVLDG